MRFCVEASEVVSASLMPEFEQLLEERDDELFDKIKYSPNHTLHQLLPAQSMASQLYDLRDRTHDSSSRTFA